MSPAGVKAKRTPKAAPKAAPPLKRKSEDSEAQPTLNFASAAASACATSAAAAASASATAEAASNETPPALTFATAAASDYTASPPQVKKERTRDDASEMGDASSNPMDDDSSVKSDDLPRIPQADCKRMLGQLKYAASKGSSEALDKYNKMSAKDKRSFFWNQFSIDPRGSIYGSKD